MYNAVNLDQHPLHLVERHVIRSSVVELRYAGRGMIGHRRSKLEGAAIFQVGGDPVARNE